MINWHFPRTKLAIEVLDNLYDKGIPRLAFFGRRRIGKTEFLQQDLIPEAVQKGVAPIYCSFWENKDQPHLAFIRALQQALPDGVMKPKFKLGFSAGVEVSAEIERADRPKAALSSELSLVASLFGEWLKHLNGRPGLIILDEIQHLATSSHFATFAASLRTMLDMAPNSIRVVFTGSSLADLQRLFQDHKAPFFNFATVQDFPPLDRAFIDYLLTLHHQITGLRVSSGELWSLFERVGHNAQLITGLVQQMVLQKTDNWQDLWAGIEEELLGENGWCENQWYELSLSDRVVYLRLLEGKDLFNDESIQLYTKLGFSRGTAQQAQRRLINRSLIHKAGHGEYQRIVPLLDDWIRKQGLVSDAFTPGNDVSANGGCRNGACE